MHINTCFSKKKLLGLGFQPMGSIDMRSCISHYFFNSQFISLRFQKVHLVNATIPIKRVFLYHYTRSFSAVLIILSVHYYLPPGLISFSFFWRHFLSSLFSVGDRVWLIYFYLPSFLSFFQPLGISFLNYQLQEFVFICSSLNLEFLSWTKKNIPNFSLSAWIHYRYIVCAYRLFFFSWI